MDLCWIMNLIAAQWKSSCTVNISLTLALLSDKTNIVYLIHPFHLVPHLTVRRFQRPRPWIKHVSSVRALIRQPPLARLLTQTVHAATATDTSAMWHINSTSTDRLSSVSINKTVILATVHSLSTKHRQTDKFTQG